MIRKLFSTETKPNAFFRHIDWMAFWGATLVAFLVYFFTLGPSVGLEDSGELTTAADNLGVPHPPGYPFWTMCGWVFCRAFSWVRYMGHPTPAWALSLFSAIAGAFAAGCTAMLICRSGSDMLDSIDSDATGRVPPANVAQRHARMGFAGGLGGALLFAFSPVEWSQSTIVEIYSLNAFFLMAVFLLSYRWMRKPSDKILWLTAFVFGLGLTNYQVLLLAALPLVLIILLRDVRLFRDLLLILIPIGLTVQVLKVGSMERASAMMGAEAINKFEPVLLAESCPKGALLWVAFGLVIAAPFVGKILAAVTRRRQAALYGTLGLGFAGVVLIALANTVFAETPVEVESLQQFVDHLACGDFPCAWTEHPDFAPLIQPATYTWIALFLAASCVLSLGASFAPPEARLADRRVWTWLVGAGLCALAACTIAFRLPAAGDGGYSGEAFSWTFHVVCLIVGLSLLLILALLTPRQRGLAFAIPVAAVQTTVFILLYKGAMNGLTHPRTWWFFWPCIWNFIMLGLAIVVLPNGRSIGLTMLFAEIGVSFYAYMPIVSDLRNPPMNWGYPRTWEGFKHALMRGQYEQIKMPPIFSHDGFNTFLKQIGFYLQDLRLQFTIVTAALALVPFAVWSLLLRVKNRARPLAVKATWGTSALYVAVAALVIAFWGFSDGEVPDRMDKWLLAFLAIPAGIGIYLILRRQTAVLFGSVVPKSRLRNVICMCLFGGLALFLAFILALSLMGKGFAGGVNIVSVSSATPEMIAKGTAVKPSAQVLRIFTLSIAGLLVLSIAEFVVHLLAAMKCRVTAALKVDIDDVSQQWLIAVGSCFAVMSFFLVALANVKGDVQDGFIQKVKFISSHGMFSLWIGYGLVIGLLVASRIICLIRWKWPRRVVLGTLCICAACVALIPIYRNYTDDKLVFKMGAAEQNGHTFGWQFGNYQLRGANAIREELSPDEEPLPNPLWPEEMGTNAVFFGGTDPGRFVPTYMIYSANVRPDVKIITQNALADGTYMSVERDLYGDDIWIPSSSDSAEAFNIYVNEVQSGKRRANGDLKIENGRVQVTGALGVMEINGILTKMMFDHERKRRAFYVEESYAIPWMYDYLSPHGLIMKINDIGEREGRPAESAFTGDVARNDMEFWDWYTRRLLKDPAFRRDFVAQKSFSKLRAAIAGLYSDSNRRNLYGKGCQLYRDYASQAYREAVALYPASPEATFRYFQDVLLVDGKWDAIIDMFEYINRVDPTNERINDREDENNEKTKGILSHVRAMKNAPATVNAILRRHWNQETPPPDVAHAPFPNELRGQLSDSELNDLAEARLDYAEANLHLGDINHAYHSLSFLNDNPARTNSFDRMWRATKAMRRLHKQSNVPQCGIACAMWATEALDAVKADENSFFVQDMAVGIFYSAYQISRDGKVPAPYRTFLRNQMNEQKGKCIKAIQGALEFVDDKDFVKKKPPLGKRTVLSGKKAASALRYVGILERFKGDGENEKTDLANMARLERNIIDMALAEAPPAQVLSAAESILMANVNNDQSKKNECAEYVGTCILNHLMARTDTTYNDLCILSLLYRACSAWADSQTLTTSFAKKSFSCYSDFAQAVDSKSAYMELAKMCDELMPLLPDEKQRLSERKEEAQRNAVHSCLKQARMCILSPQPNIKAAYSLLDEADKINPNYAKEMSILKFLNLK